METKKTITVNNLSHFIEIIKLFPNSENYFYRGENRNYGRTRLTASAFRDENVSSFFKLNVDEFYSEIGHRLSDIEKNDFLAFAQHHGLPTNLLDVTSNPLTALFFACYGSQGIACLYIFNSKYIDITGNIHQLQSEHKEIFDPITDLINLDSLDNVLGNFNLIYKPKITFERARIQKGFFIYQLYSIDKKPYIPIYKSVLKISNTKEILTELDNIGVNLGTIYGDYDNIAKYIKEKNY
ncbi:MAG: FRG domain-containing protein [Defluviitaleaceae bacterium]|nr:FRG domain-containing protein [Defluviitaleaceae bacterium]